MLIWMMTWRSAEGKRNMSIPTPTPTKLLRCHQGRCVRLRRCCHVHRFFLLALIHGASKCFEIISDSDRQSQAPRCIFSREYNWTPVTAYIPTLSDFRAYLQVVNRALACVQVFGVYPQLLSRKRGSLRSICRHGNQPLAVYPRCNCMLYI